MFIGYNMILDYLASDYRIPLLICFVKLGSQPYAWIVWNSIVQFIWKFSFVSYLPDDGSLLSRNM